MSTMTSRLCATGFCVLMILLVVLAAACGYDEGKDLPAVVEGVRPAGAELVGECTGSPGVIESPSRECTYLVPGETDEVTAAVAEELANQGFAVSCRLNETTTEIAGLRGKVRVRAEVTADGSVTDGGGVNVYEPDHVPPGGKAIPAGSVALWLTASRQREASANFQRHWIASGLPCTEGVLNDQTLEACVAGWNASDNPGKRQLVRRRMRVPVADVFLRSNGPGVSSGCFFGFLAHGGRYLMFESSWREGSLVFAKPQLGYSSAKGLNANARVRPDGGLTLKPPSLNEQCQVWWNAPAGAEARAATVRRRLRAEVEAVYEEGQTPRCTYTLRSNGRYLEVVVELKEGRWATTPLRRLEPKRPFRPNGELLGSGWLTVGS